MRLRDNHFVRTLARACACALLTASFTAMADTRDAIYRLDIPAQSLEDALQALALASQHKLLYDSKLVRGKTSGPLKGEFTAAEAVRQLLSGTDLSYEVTPSGLVLIRKPGVSNAPPAVSSGTEAASARPVEPVRFSMAGADAPVAEAGVQQTLPAENAARDSGGGTQVRQIDAVIVTAQKRAERLEDVPLPVQAIGEERLYKLGAKNLGDYAGTVAGLTVSDAGPGRSQIFIRGVSAPQGYMGMESAIGVYLDEVPISEGVAQPDMNLYDINRVEVLRGPQGTLYGSSSLGGTIRIITNRPDPGDFSGLVSTEISSTEHGGLNASYHGVLNLPIVPDRLAARAVLYGRNVDGFIDDPIRDASNVNDEETYGARVGVRYQPSTYWTFDLTGAYQSIDLGSPNTAEDIGGSYRELKQYRNFSTPSKDRNNIYNGTVLFEGEVVNFTSSTSFGQRERSLHSDITGGNLLGNGAFTPSFQGYASNSFTQEARFSSVRVTPFSWLLGVYYNRKTTDFFQDVDSVGAAEEFGLSSDRIAMLRESNAVRQMAVFGEVGYSPYDRLTLTMGLRASRIETSAAMLRTGFLFGESGLNNRSEGDDRVFVPKFNVSYKVGPSALVYAQASKGYRIGGQNVAFLPLGDGFEFPASYDPDSLWNYEAGFKGVFLDRRLNFNVAAFYIDWKDIQLSLQHRGYDYFTNAGNAISKGLEFEGSLLASDNVQLGAQVTYTDSTLSTTTPGVGNKGARVPNVAPLSTSGFVEIGHDMDLGHLYARFDVQRTGQRYTGFGSAGRVYGDFATVNARVGLDSYNWRFAFFVRNVFDRRGRLGAGAYQAGVVQVPGIQTVTVNRPRTFGIEITRTF